MPKGILFYCDVCRLNFYFPMQNLRNLERQVFITKQGQIGYKHFQTNNYSIKYTKIEKSNKNKLNLKTLFLDPIF